MKLRVEINEGFEHLFETDPEIRFYVEMGGAGSGKSYSMAQAMLARIMTAERRRVLVVRKVRNTIRHSVFDLLAHVIADMRAEALFQVNRSDLSVTFVNGNQIICTGLDDVAKLKSIFGITDIWCEEATELTGDDFRQLNLRLRGGTVSKHLYVTFNPVSSQSWLKAEFFDRPKANAHVHRSTFEDNAFIDEAYRMELRALKGVDEYFYQVYALGNWGQLGNQVFTNYVVEDFPYHEEDLEGVCQGVDFGFNHASAIERAGFHDGELYVFDELYAKGITNTDLVEAATEFYPDPTAVFQTADSAEADRIEDFNRAGIATVGAKKGAGSVRKGIDFLKSYRIHVHETRCPNLAREIENYKWREDKDGNPMDEPVPFNDDTIAALRYAVEDLWNVSGGFRPVEGLKHGGNRSGKAYGVRFGRDLDSVIDGNGR